MNIRLKRLIGSLKSQAGLSIVATVLTLLMLSLFIAVAVSLVTTGSNSAVQERQGVQALFIADGGQQYTAKINSFPNYGVSPAVNLGRGSFTVSVPTLSAAINNAAVSITVSSTEGFVSNPGDVASPYWVMLCDTATNPKPNLDATSANCEKISFTTKTTPPTTPATFTVGTRGRDRSGAAAHLQNAVVLMYRWSATPVTQLNGAHTAGTTTINVDSTAGFAIPPAFIRINDANENNREDVLYRGMTANSFTNCVRGAYDAGSGAAKVDNAFVYQSEISVLPISTGIIPGNPFAGNVQRSVQISVLPLR